MFAVGGEAFYGINPVFFWHTGVKASAKVNIIVDGVEAELTQVGGGDGDGRPKYAEGAFAFVLQYQINLHGVPAGRIVDGVPNHQTIAIRRALAFINFSAAIDF